VFILVSIGTRSVKFIKKHQSYSPKYSGTFLWLTVHIVYDLSISVLMLNSELFDVR